MMGMTSQNVELDRSHDRASRRAHERGQPSSDYSSQGVAAQDVAHLMARIARQLDTEQGVDATLHALVAAAVDAIPGADSAGITHVYKRGLKLDVAYASDPFVVDLDTAQFEVREGPCLHSAYEHRTVRVEDFATEQRWPTFARRAHELGAGSQLALQLYVDGDDMAALNVYSRQVRGFSDESEQIGLLFASHAAIAMSTARREQQFRAGMDSRDVIGQAKGILMQRRGISADEAFDLLRRASQDLNVKLAELAHTLATRHTELDLPGR
jgi:putative methionine-R-sulfoxide reductase with GAF domain